MSEKLNSGSEKKESSAESLDTKDQLEKAAERLREKAEKESSAEDREKAQVESKKSAEKLAISGKEKAPDGSEKKSSRQPAHKHAKQQTYRATMRRVESKLPSYQRAFSRVVNNPTVDKVSNVTGKTVARPSGMLGGGIFAFAGLAVVTLVANQQGFPVNGGAVFIALLFLGWIVGVVIEFAYKLIKKAA